MKKLLCIVLALILTLGAASCGTEQKQTVDNGNGTAASKDDGSNSYADPQSTAPGLTLSTQNLMNGIIAKSIDPIGDFGKHGASLTDFAVRLFKQSNESGKSTLVSPLSVLYALSMCANGAEGSTLTEMEAVLGIPSDELNLILYSYMNALPQGEKYKLNLANSVWFTSDSRFTVNREFLQTNADYYGADVFKAPFDDSTLEDINSWCNEKTEGLIPEIIDEIPAAALMYIINALIFDAEWEDEYTEQDVYDGNFTTEDGTKKDVEFMHSEEYKYLEDGKATGFIKYYQDRKYAFAALLPNEGISVDEYLTDLDGEQLYSMLSSPKDNLVLATMPKFETETSLSLNKVLEDMGMPTAFAPSSADFSGLGTSTGGNIFISRVMHKTFISVTENGTKAGAVTSIELEDESAPDYENAKTVKLDRPFVYMLIDCTTNTPFFIGTLMDTAE